MVALRSQSKDSAGKENSLDNLSERLVTVLDPGSAASEAYRTLRTNLLHAFAEASPKVIVVTSPGPTEAKSTVCANLGVVLAQAYKRTLVVDCDLRKPAMHEIFGLRSTRGVVDALKGEHGLQEICQEPLPEVGPKVLAAGALPPDPGELLDVRLISRFFARLKHEFDYVLVDSPPIGFVSDPIVLATQGDGVLLTLDAKRTSKEDLQRAVRSLKMVGANVLGTVFGTTGQSYR